MLVSGSFLFSLLLILVGVKLYARSLGIRSKHWYNDAGLFAPDSVVGYVNRPNLDRYNYFTVHERTNERGFKRASETTASKAKGDTRIFGIGDSMMWGIGVGEHETFLGRLESLLNPVGRVEVITL